MESYIRGLPKAELHMHLEGSIEPEMMLALAERNRVALRWKSAAALRAAYLFNDLQSFLDLYYDGCRVMLQERDYYDVTRAYLDGAHADGVRRAELFVAPQGAAERNVAPDAVMAGVLAAMDDAARACGISSGILIIAQRHRSEAEALQMLDSMMPWAGRIAGFGLGGAELGNPATKFARYFRACRERGFRICAHAGEEGPAATVREAVETIGVDRVDHGVTCMQDPAVVALLAEHGTPLTVCPLSNVKLKVVPTLAAHPLPAMLAAGLNVSINSDDPAYFDGSIHANLVACQKAFGFSAETLAQLARNSFAAAFIPPSEVAEGISLVNAWYELFRSTTPTA